MSGCTEVTCTSVTSATGYDFTNVDEYELYGSEFEVNDVTCDTASGYEGTAVAVVCETDGPYTMTGCDPIVCTRPSSSHYDFTNVVEGNLDLSSGSFDVTGLDCAAGYDGTAVAAACTTSGPYDVSGCEPIVCMRPSSSGYDFTNIAEGNLDLSSGDFDVTGVTCASGYEGTATPVVCATDGPYTMTGCDPIVCTRPNSSHYDFTNVVEGNLDLSSGSFDVTELACAAGYAGTAVADPCSTSGPYTVSNCTEMRCDDVDAQGTAASCGNDATCVDGSTGGGYSCACVDGYEGDTTANGPAICSSSPNVTTVVVVAVAIIATLGAAAGAFFSLRPPCESAINPAESTKQVDTTASSRYEPEEP